ncbi:MAG: sensor histidine kinase [Rhodoferax sp.]|nr:sensor histidine kinase [Rhodoferax sp.]
MARTDMDSDARIAELEAELAALRREMQDLTYVVGHDLRAPLRHIVSFAQLVKEDAGPQLSSEVQGFLDTITVSAQNLTQMLDALLELSRVGTVPLQPVQVSLQALVQEVTNDLTALHPTRQLKWQIADDLPTWLADPVLLRGALKQTLGNAVKFTAKKDVAVISIRTIPDGQHLVLEIADNGAGFNPAMQSKLLQPFQRLHHVREFPGLGMGLALARKSIERMGGGIRIEGQLDAGCRVILTLPLQLT